MGKLSKLKDVPLLGSIVYSIYMKNQSRRIHRSNILRVNNFNVDKSKRHIYYLDVPVHTNLGDMAQYVCTIDWLQKNYPNTDIVEIDGLLLSDLESGIIEKLKTIIKPDELIFFQSGYCTQDLGGYHDKVHIAIVDAFPDNKIVMLPQTVYFKNPENAKRTSDCYQKHSKIKFFARDFTSEKLAKKLFPNLEIYPYPDIVTTLIGTKDTDRITREGIIFCIRDDSEKYYSDEDINILSKKLVKYGNVDIVDTTVNESFSTFKDHAKQSISEMIDRFAASKLIITDRYHGTIFSLVGNTPVIVIKTTDHKVKTGVEWFRGIYDDTVFFANDLEEAFILAEKILKNYDYHNLNPYFQKKYYDKLKDLIEE